MGVFSISRKKGQKFTHKHKKDYKGVATMQADGYEEVFKNFFKHEKFDVVIELGTRSGGLTLFISDVCKCKVHTVEKFKKFLKDDTKKRLVKKGVKIHFQDIHQSEFVPTLIKKQKGRVLLLCDNGSKINEINKFSKFLKPNDIVMAHDYFSTVEEYHNQNRWKACEIIDKYIEYDVIEKYKPYYEKFKKVYWLCTIRKGK